MKLTVQIKVCGNKHLDNIAELTDLEVDYLGFIFYQQSKRYINNLLISSINTTAKKVGVFVNEDLNKLIDLVNFHQLDVIQLHGDESPEYCKELKDKINHEAIEIWKAFGINEHFNFEQLTAYQPFVNKFVFDTKTNEYGGSGRKFNWDILKQYKLSTFFFLSGGIRLDDVNSILDFEHEKCCGLDINSGFEIEPGIKNRKEIEKFINNIKQSKTKHMSKYQPNEKGFYGDFGGAFIPELLHANCEELKQAFDQYYHTAEFQAEFQNLLKDYVGRPSPLYYAPNLSKRYGAHILLKREDLNHTGAHKVNNTIGQALLAKRMGKTKILAETGAGQHGVATATICALLGLECTVFMGEIDVKRQAPNVARMKMLGAEVIPATSGSKTLKDATNEAIRYWINNPETYYLIGSVVGPHPYPALVAKFQSVISEEIRKQLEEKYNKPTPDYVIACVGGGSNAAGAFYHFLDDEEVQLIAVEAAGLGVESGETAATMQKGTEGIIHGSRTIVMQDADGQIVEPYSISAGLDYPGVGPLHAHLFKSKRGTFLNATDEEALKAAFLLTKEEGIIPALESAHALAVLEKMKFKPEDIVVVNLSGRGDKDMETYMNFSEKFG